MALIRAVVLSAPVRWLPVLFAAFEYLQVCAIGAISGTTSHTACQIEDSFLRYDAARYLVVPNREKMPSATR
jgi:hypothetical protein